MQQTQLEQLSNMPVEETIYNGGPNPTLKAKDWIQVQEKAFIRWINLKLSENGCKQISSLEDLATGIPWFNLINSLLPGLELRPIYSKPVLKVQKLENVNKLLDFLTNHQQLQIHNIGPEDIVDGNVKLILGLIWVILLNYTQIEQDSDEEMEVLTKKEILLRWCQRVTKDYKCVKVVNFTSSWSNGLAICAILNYFEPELLDFQQLESETDPIRTERALQAAQSIGITRLVDVDDLNCPRPDEKSVIAYVSLFYDKFRSAAGSKEQNKRLQLLKIRVETFFRIILEIAEYKNEYFARIEKLLQTINGSLSRMEFDGKNNTERFMTLRSTLMSYRKGEKTTIIREVGQLKSLHSKLNMMLLEYSFPQLSEPEDCSLALVTSSMKKLTETESNLNSYMLKFVKNKKYELLKKFTTLCSNIELGINLIDQELTELPNFTADQVNELPEILEDLKSLELMSQNLSVLKKEIDSYQTPENPEGLGLSFEQLQYLLKADELRLKIELIRNIIVDKLQFIELHFNKKDRIYKILRYTAGHEELPSAADYQFEIIFDRFDTGNKSYLNKQEFQAALQYIYPNLSRSSIDEFFEFIYNSKNDVLRGVRLPEFLGILKMSEQDEEEQEDVQDNGNDITNLTSDFYLNAFREISGGQDYITEDDLLRLKLDSNLVDRVGAVMDTENDADKSFNYAKFFGNDEDSMVWLDRSDMITLDGEGVETGTLKDLDNILEQLDGLRV